MMKPPTLANFALPIIVIIACYFSHFSNAAFTSSEAIRAAEQFRSSFGVPYQTAIGFLANSVLQPLAQAPVPSSSAAAEPLVTAFKTSIDSFNQQLHPLSEASNRFRLSLDALTETITAEHSRTEILLLNMSKEIEAVSVNIASAQQQLDTAQRQVDATESSLQSSERVVRDAENRLDKGENCIIRKKRGFFKSIGRVFENAGKAVEKVVTRDIPHVVKQVVNSPCQLVINIGNLRRDRDRAKNERDAAVTRRQNAQQVHSNYLAARNSLLQQQGELNNKKAGLGVTLAQLNEEKVKAVAINEKIKKMIVHLTGLLDRGTMLHDILGKLIDMETLINPLNEVSQLLLAFNNDGSDARTLESLKTSIQNSVLTLQTKLPSYPMITFNIRRS